MKTNPGVFLGIAAVLFVAALYLALTQDPWRVHSAPGGAALAPNVLAGLAALGFGIAGGLSLIAAALASWDRAPPAV
jgi:hypothetical protein